MNIGKLCGALFVVFIPFFLELKNRMITGLTYAYALLTAAVVLIVVFIGYERRSRYPLIYLQVFRIRQLSGGLFALIFNIITWTAVLLLLSLQFQLVNNQSPLEAV